MEENATFSINKSRKPALFSRYSTNGEKDRFHEDKRVDRDSTSFLLSPSFFRLLPPFSFLLPPFFFLFPPRSPTSVSHGNGMNYAAGRGGGRGGAIGSALGLEKSLLLLHRLSSSWGIVLIKMMIFFLFFCFLFPFLLSRHVIRFFIIYHEVYHQVLGNRFDQGGNFFFVFLMIFDDF